MLLMQFGYLSMEEDKAMALIRKTTNFVYQPPQPRGWSSLGSEKEIEGTWVKDTRTRVRRLKGRSFNLAFLLVDVCTVL